VTVVEIIQPVELARFTIEGEPVSKSRARFTRRGYKVHTYTPEATLAAERQVASAFKAACPLAPDSESAFRLVADFHQATRQRRDVDNMVKLICDGLNGVAWKDDVQVHEIAGRKSFVAAKEDARTEVVIYRLAPIQRPQAPCQFCREPMDIYPSTKGVRKFCNQKCHLAWRRAQKTRECPNCGTTFRAKESRQIHCSAACLFESNRETTNCCECGKEFTEQRHLVKARRKKLWCSETCRDITRSRLARECLYGHPREGNTATRADGRTYCKGCARDRARKRKETS